MGRMATVSQRPLTVAWVAVVAFGCVGCFERGGRDKVEPGPPPSISAQPRTLASAEVVGTIDPSATIRVRLEAEPAHLNPLLGGDAVADRVALGPIYEGLLCEGVLGREPNPCLAESYQRSADGRLWTFDLRRGVTWHDGQPFDAADVVFTYRALVGVGRVPTLLAAEVDDLQSISAKGDRVTMRFREHRFGRAGVFARIPIVAQHVFGRTPPAQMASSINSGIPIGTGPMILEQWDTGQRIVMRRNDDYWGEKALATKVMYRILPSRPRALAELATGGLDLAAHLPIDEALAHREDNPDVRAVLQPRPAYLAAVYNTRHPALAKRDVRAALTHLLDRESIVAALFGGSGQVVTSPYIPGSESEAAVVPLAFDRDKAATLLAGDRGVHVTVSVPAGSRTMARIADIWARDAHGLVDLEVSSIPYADLLARGRAGEFDVALMAFTTSNDVELYHRFHSSQTGAENWGAVSDAQLDGLLIVARNESDPARRRLVERRIHGRLHWLQPYTFIAADRRAGLFAPGVGAQLATAYGYAPHRLYRTK
jgi:peptide/nickel transport system substrate-binding protein